MLTLPRTKANKMDNNMKTTYILTYALCLCAISMSCDQNTKVQQKIEPKTNIEIPDSLEVDTIEKVKINNSTIEIYTAFNNDRTTTYEFWYKDSKQVHSVQYPFFEINYKWFADLDNNNDIEVIRAQGYEDGIDYGIYEKKEHSEELLLRFNPVLLDQRYPNKIFWGYPWDMERIVINNKKQILSSFQISDERDDNYSMPEEQKQMPFVFFHGKTTQPDFELKTESSGKEYVTLSELITKAFQPSKKQYQVPSDYYILDSASIVADNVSYRILLLEKQSEKNNKSHNHFGLPIIVLQNNIEIEKNFDVVLEYDDNCPAEGCGAIIVEGKKFTIQQIFCSDFLFVRSETTFKIEQKTNEILLQEYSEKYTDRSNPDRLIPDKKWSIHDFGKVLFQETTDLFLRELRQAK